jgi:hypothetical protein
MSQDFNQAEYIARKFGGRPKYAAAINEPLPKVNDWCRRTGFVPEYARMRTLQAARRECVDITAFDFVRHLVKLAD